MEAPRKAGAPLGGARGTHERKEAHMLRHITSAVAAIGALLFAGAATAGLAGSDYGGQLAGKVTSVNRAQNLLVLDTSTTLRATDPSMLAKLREGELVTVDFEVRNGTKLINEIRPAAPDTTVGVSPSGVGGIKQH
jgi:predicted phage tail protein